VIFLLGHGQAPNFGIYVTVPDGSDDFAIEMEKNVILPHRVLPGLIK
jgi:hypothetical protein